MQAQESQEVLVVVESYALIDPNAVMVEFFDTMSAHTAMFGSWRFLEIASPALVTFLKDDVIVFEAFNCPYYLRSL